VKEKIVVKKNYRKRRKELGICIDCKSRDLHRAGLCQKCWEKRSEYSKKYFSNPEKRKEANRKYREKNYIRKKHPCVCGVRETWNEKCWECSNAKRKYDKNRRNKCSIEGVCIVCKGKLYTKTKCKACSDKLKLYAKERRIKFIQLGICGSCKKHPLKTKTLCEYCLQKLKERNNAAYKSSTQQ
jgi:hypothetical protein